MAYDPTEGPRREMLQDINGNPGSREALEQMHGEVYDTQQLGESFTVESFLAPFVGVTRKSDGAQGSMLFQHSPRYYWGFEPK